MAGSRANLLQGIGLNQVPYFFRDPASGQTFAQAYDALAAQLRGGTAAAGVTAQPWFENLLPNLAPSNGSRTSALAERQTANLITGNLSSLFLGFIDGVAAQPFNNRQVQSIRLASSVGRVQLPRGCSSARANATPTASPWTSTTRCPDRAIRSDWIKPRPTPCPTRTI